MKLHDYVIGFLIVVCAILLAQRCSAFELEVTDYQGMGSHKGTSYWQNTVGVKGITYLYGHLYGGVELDLTKYSFGMGGAVKAVCGYDYLLLRNLPAFVEVSGGTAVKSGASNLNAKHNNLIGPGLCGTFGATVGVRVPVYKTIVSIGVGYDHLSSFRSGDKGLNTFGPKIGLRW